MDIIKRELASLMEKTFPGENIPLVFGEGDINARVMLIGEAPGEQESLQGRPFVGKAGKNLDAFLAATGLRREEMYITNTVKFRPSKISPAGRRVNRPPTKAEISLFAPFLIREADIVRPDIIVTLGNVPLFAVAGPGITIGAVHGRLMEASGRRIFPMYHPAAIIYNRSLQPVFAEDMARLAAITENLPKNN